uniref:Uncharacterized protein n=1 Tax=Hemiselmis andersenii TaxID=464988 RepID=A0A6T8NET2_HEMAN|mmetsp:Transcript_19854/g.45703  ORF Transcript_19854/g.45703 Transcript_19854/m.45703 type:complete len:524 (-) Transcript_19854:137-1708(-)
MEEPQGPGGDALLNLAVELYDLLQRKDTSMGELLQTMESKKGLEKKTEEQSDEVVSMQGEADEMFRNLIRGIRKVGSGGTISEVGDERKGDGGDDEVEELRARLSNVTMREKERVEGLQAQLEMMRVELRECRKQRSMDQSIIAAADSQTTQLKASLRMTQEDAESLRGTLEQELARGHALQGRVNQLEGELRAAKTQARGDKDEIARLQALVDLGQRQVIEAPPLRVVQRPSSAGRAAGGQEAAVVAVAVEGGAGEEEASDRAMYEAYVQARKQQLLQGQGAQRESEMVSAEDAEGKDVHRIPTAGADGAQGDDSTEGGTAVASASRPASRQPVGGIGRPPGVTKRQGAPSPQPLQVSVSDGGSSSFMAPVGSSRRARGPDTTTLDYLMSRVRLGHITKSTPLQLALEFCGKSSFSLRHNEEKYNQLAEQMVGLAYQHLRDRWITVLKNAEPIDNKGTTKQPRLGSFEVELLWTDVNKEPRRTLLHSKLKARVFPSVARIVQELKEALNAPAEDGDGEELGA